MNEHIHELGASIVQASTQAAMADLGDRRIPNRPHHLDVVQVPPWPGPIPQTADHENSSTTGACTAAPKTSANRSR